MLLIIISKLNEKLLKLTVENEILKNRLENLIAPKVKSTPVSSLQKRAFRNVVSQKESQTDHPGFITAKNTHAWSSQNAINCA